MIQTFETCLLSHVTWPCEQLAVVNNICWNSGLNPYQLYDDCYGGVPAANGIISQSASSINMMLPDAVPLLGQGARERYLKVNDLSSYWHHLPSSISLFHLETFSVPPHYCIIEQIDAEIKLKCEQSCCSIFARWWIVVHQKCMPAYRARTRQVARSTSTTPRWGRRCTCPTSYRDGRLAGEEWRHRNVTWSRLRCLFSCFK